MIFLIVGNVTRLDRNLVTIYFIYNFNVYHEGKILMNVKIFIAFATLLLVGCIDRYHDNYYDEPAVRVKSIVTEDAQFAIPAKIIIELENIGYATAYDVSGSVDLEVGTLVTESVYFTVPIIKVGRSVIVELALTTVNFHDEYDRYVLEFGWYDYYDNYYY